MANLFKTTIIRFRNLFGGGRSPNDTLSPDDQSADKPNQPPLNQEASVSKDDYLQYDGQSINTVFPSYSQATAAPGTAIDHATSHSKCRCDDHSLQTPNRGLLDQPSTSRGILSKSLTTSFGKVEGLDTEALSSLTLKPIHPNIHYHLSFNHLHNIRRDLSPKFTQVSFQGLNSHGKSTTETTATYYRWLSDIYYDTNTFLQRQQICCDLSRWSKKSEHFIGCPHQSLSISKPKFRQSNDILEVETWVTNHPPRCPSHPSKKWSSFQGSFAQMTVCTVCHSDLECTLELSGSYLRVYYTCYRDLGPAASPNDPKWLAVLAGEGSPRSEDGELKLYARVWNVARKLRGRELREVTHQTPTGLFNVSDERYKRESGN